MYVCVWPLMGQHVQYACVYISVCRTRVQIKLIKLYINGMHLQLYVCTCVCSMHMCVNGVAKDLENGGPDGPKITENVIKKEVGKRHQKQGPQKS